MSNWNVRYSFPLRGALKGFARGHELRDACVGTNVIGVKEEICHLRTGFLCEPDPESIGEAIQTVLVDGVLQTLLGENARRYVMERYSADCVLQLELAAYQEVVRA